MGMRILKEAIKFGLMSSSPLIRPFIPKGPFVLTYHGVGDSDHSITTDPDVFRSHVEVVADSPLDVRTLSEFLDMDQPEETVIFTFDDGTQGQFTHASSILEEYGYSGVFFLTTGNLGEPNYMSWEEADKLSDTHEIGAHTKTHPDLATLDEQEELNREVIEAKIHLERRLNTSVDHFAYPYGQEDNISTAVAKTASQADYRTICSTTGSLPNQISQPNKTGPLLIERIPINDGPSSVIKNLLYKHNIGLRAFETTILRGRSRHEMRKAIAGGLDTKRT